MFATPPGRAAGPAPQREAVAQPEAESVLAARRDMKTTNREGHTGICRSGASPNLTHWRKTVVGAGQRLRRTRKTVKANKALMADTISARVKTPATMAKAIPQGLHRQHQRFSRVRMPRF
jgi:hypothetical protein